MFKHFSNHSLQRELVVTVSQDCNTSARMLGLIAEFDARKLYRPAGYESMYLYCLHELHMSEDVACKRICAARAARRFPAIFAAVAEGKLHLSAVVMLAPHLTDGNAEALLEAATRETKSRIELLLAQLFPKPDVPTLIQAVPPTPVKDQAGLDLSSGPAILSAPGRIDPVTMSNSAVQMEPLPTPVPAPIPPRVKPVPLSPGRFALQLTVDQATHDQLRYAQSLLGHAVPSGDVAEVLKRALDALVEKLEKQKFAKSARSRPQSGVAKGRYVPAAVRSAVWERDGGQCTFVSENGKRCESRSRIELDHIEPVARGGQTTVKGIRLRCRAHNQYTAERTFGEAFMIGKRQHSIEIAARVKVNAQARAVAEEQARAAGGAVSPEQPNP
jgi:hypothetical protein